MQAEVDFGPIVSVPSNFWVGLRSHHWKRGYKKLGSGCKQHEHPYSGSDFVRWSRYTFEAPYRFPAKTDDTLQWQTILEYLLEQLVEQGIIRFCLLTGYLGEQIQEYFGDGGSWRWKITYSHGPVEWDTGRRIWEAQSELEERFLLLYSDNFAPFSMEKVLWQHERHGLPLTFMVSPKTPGNLEIDELGIVQHYDNQRGKDLPFVEIGYMVVERDRVLSYFPQPDCSFSSVLRQMAAQQQIGAWIQQDAYHSISDPQRWERAERYLEPKKIVLLDRDGVINEKAVKGEYVNCWEEFRWIERTRDSLRQLSKLGFRFIVISNQAGIARGMTTLEEVERIHQKNDANSRSRRD